MVPQETEQVPAAGSSMMVKHPSWPRTKACRAALASRMNPVIAPEALMPLGKVPRPGAVPAPGASNVVMVVVFSPAFAKKPSPNVHRTRQSADLNILINVFDNLFFI